MEKIEEEKDERIAVAGVRRALDQAERNRAIRPHTAEFPVEIGLTGGERRDRRGGRRASSGAPCGSAADRAPVQLACETAGLVGATGFACGTARRTLRCRLVLAQAFIERPGAAGYSRSRSGISLPLGSTSTPPHGAPCRSSRDRVGSLLSPMATRLMTGQAKSGGHDVAADAEKLRDLYVPGDPLLWLIFGIR